MAIPNKLTIKNSFLQDFILIYWLISYCHWVVLEVSLELGDGRKETGTGQESRESTLVQCHLMLATMLQGTMPSAIAYESKNHQTLFVWICVCGVCWSVCLNMFICIFVSEQKGQNPYLYTATQNITNHREAANLKLFRKVTRQRAAWQNNMDPSGISAIEHGPGASLFRISSACWKHFSTQLSFQRKATEGLLSILTPNCFISS